MTEGGERGYVDSAAVLAYSLRRLHSRYPPDLIALVAPEVQASRSTLQAAGWRVLERQIPIKASDIRNPQIADEVTRDGCCGIAEMLKLEILRLTEYDWVLFLDSDTMVLQSLDPLLELDAGIVYTKGFFPSELVQGGFILVRPNPKIYEDLFEILREGDFRTGSGWRGSGFGWVYGGRTVQGLMPYYVNTQMAKTASCQVDVRRFNNQQVSDEQEATPIADVRLVHFTKCMKPWRCMPIGWLYTNDRTTPSCEEFVKAWWQFSDEAEAALARARGEAWSRRPLCPSGRYMPMRIS